MIKICEDCGWEHITSLRHTERQCIIHLSAKLKDLERLLFQLIEDVRTGFYND